MKSPHTKHYCKEWNRLDVCLTRYSDDFSLQLNDSTGVNDQ